MSQILKIDDDNDGVCETEIIMDPNWSIEERITCRSSMSCTLIDSNSSTIENGKEIQLYESDGITFLWGGIIIDVDDYEDDDNSVDIFYDLKIEDYTVLTTRALARISYENKTIDYIVKNLIDRYLGNTINPDYDFGITEGIIQTGLATIDLQIFNYLNIYECLDILSGYGNYIWNIDKNKKLNFYTIGYIVNPTAFNNLSTIFKNLKRHRTMSNYRNYQYVRGNNKITNYRTNEIPSPSPDGIIKSFTLKFPVAKTPQIEVDIGAGFVNQSVGVRGIDSENDFEWFWTYDSNTISTSDSVAALAIGVDIRVSYYGLVPIMVASKNSAEITSRGIYEHYVKNEYLNSIPDSIKYANEILKKYAEIADNITFDLYEKTYSPMEQFYLTHSKLLISSELFLVESVTWSLEIDCDNIVYKYKVLDGAALGGWEELFKEMFKPNYIETGATDLIVAFEEYNDNLSWSGVYEATEYDDLLFPADDLFPADLLHPNNDSINILGGASD